MTIVPFQPAHADGFRSLVVDTLREFGFEPDPLLDADLDDPAGAYASLWIVVDGDDVVGSVALRDLGDATVLLTRMYLRPAARGRGTGKQLLGVALGWAREHGVRSVRLDTSGRMVAAQRLYEAHGFRRVPGEAPRQGQCRLLYELIL
jgi:GNAT superfamily N-acetyltransferase